MQEAQTVDNGAATDPDSDRIDESSDDDGNEMPGLETSASQSQPPAQSRGGQLMDRLSGGWSNLTKGGSSRPRRSQNSKRGYKSGGPSLRDPSGGSFGGPGMGGGDRIIDLDYPRAFPDPFSHTSKPQQPPPQAQPAQQPPTTQAPEAAEAAVVPTVDP